MKLKIKQKTMLSIAEVLAWLLISAGVCRTHLRPKNRLPQHRHFCEMLINNGASTMQRCDSFQGRSGQVIGSQCNNEATHKVSAKSRFKTLSLCKQCASAYQRYPKEFTVIKINKD